jgi:hypothetical protein
MSTTFAPTRPSPASNPTHAYVIATPPDALDERPDGAAPEHVDYVQAWKADVPAAYWIEPKESPAAQEFEGLYVSPSWTWHSGTLTVGDSAEVGEVIHTLAQAAERRFQATAAQAIRILGARLAAYISGAESTQAVTLWARGEEAPDDDAQVKIRIALNVGQLLARSEGQRTMQTWFLGANRHLGARAPARVLREGTPSEAAPSVLAAARAFAHAAGA